MLSLGKKTANRHLLIIEFPFTYLFIFNSRFYSPTGTSSNCSTSHTSSLSPCFQEDIPTPCPHPTRPLNSLGPPVFWGLGASSLTEPLPGSPLLYVLGAEYKLVYAVWLVLHNGMLLNYYEWWHPEFCRQMDGTWKYHPEWGNSDPKFHAWYVLTNKWILANNILQNTQDTVHRTQKVQQAEGPKYGLLSPTWEGEENNHIWRRREVPGRESEWGWWERGTWSGIGWEKRT